RIPPDAMTGPPVASTSARLTTVGIPQPAKSCPSDCSALSSFLVLSAALTASTAAQDVPPQPPMSIALAPAPQHCRAVAAEIPQPVSLMMTGVLNSRQRPSIAARQPVAL